MAEGCRRSRSGLERLADRGRSALPSARVGIRRDPHRTRFFFQAGDGIRDLYVTGVQTCALPISASGPNTTADGEPIRRASVSSSRAGLGAEPSTASTTTRTWGMSLLDETVSGHEAGQQLAAVAVVLDQLARGPGGPPGR